MNRLLAFTLSALITTVPAFAQPAGIAGLEQRASTPIVIYDTFDYADGTLIDGVGTADGHSTWGGGLSHAVVENGELTNTGNSYSEFAYSATPGGTPQLVPSFGGTFRYNINPGTGVSTVLIGDKDGTLSKFIHLELGLYAWTLSVSDSPSYPFPTVLGSDSYLRPLTVGIIYGASVDFDDVNCKVTIHLPDGQSKTFTHPAVCDVSPTFPRFQLGASTSAGAASWTSVWAGPSKAKTFAALGQAADQLDVSKLIAVTNKISGWKRLPLGGGGTAFATFTLQGPQAVNTLRIHLVAKADGAYLPGRAMDTEDYVQTFYTNGSSNVVGTNSNTFQLRENDGVSAISIASVYSPSLSGGIVTLYATPYVSGANAAYVPDIFLNYTVTAEGDSGGILTPQ